jgi:hypothetical protein
MSLANWFDGGVGTDGVFSTGKIGLGFMLQA